MSETHFNAMRMEADELEKEATQKLAQVQQLRDQANALDPDYKPPKTSGHKFADAPYQPKIPGKSSAQDWDEQAIAADAATQK